MRSFAIESTGAYLGEFEIANPFAAVISPMKRGRH
jgi:hypothetical protein